MEFALIMLFGAAISGMVLGIVVNIIQDVLK